MWGVLVMMHLSADVLVDVEFQQRLSLSLWRCKGKAGAEEQEAGTLVQQRFNGAEFQRQSYYMCRCADDVQSC